MCRLHACHAALLLFGHLQGCSSRRTMSRGAITRYSKNGEIFYRCNKTTRSTSDPRLCDLMHSFAIPSDADILVACSVDVDYEHGATLRTQFDMHVNLRELSSRMRSLHKDDYPFVVYAFAVQGYTNVPFGYTQFISHRIGRFLIRSDTLIGEDGQEQLFCQMIVDGPNHSPYIEGIAHPPSFKSVKLVKGKEIIVKGCAILGYHKQAEDERKWVGWNDATGILRFEYKCARALYMKHSTWMPDLQYVMFTARWTANSWLVTEVTYSTIDIIMREVQMPSMIFFVEDLKFLCGDGGMDNAHPQAIFQSIGKTTYSGKPLQVTVKFVNAKFVGDDVEYGAIVAPIYSNDGREVRYHALALLPRDEWMSGDNKILIDTLYIWYSNRQIDPPTGQLFSPELR